MIPPETHGHVPVLLAAVLELLKPAHGMTVVDCTLGRGGHAHAIAGRLGSSGTLIGLDVDPRNLDYARSRLADTPCRVRLFHANFAQLDQVLDECGTPAADAILADLGLSTNQFLDPAYGQSFAADAPLDMRLDPRTQLTAADLVNRLPEKQLAELIYGLSDERFSRRIARKIVEARAASPIKSTRELAELVRRAVPRSPGRKSPDRIDPATRTFMALRMKVNAEPENLDRLLEIAPGRLRPGGRLAVISFHSVEDRAVKQAFRSAERTGLLRIITRKPVTPDDAEVAANPRARSAKLRAAERT